MANKKKFLLVFSGILSATVLSLGVVLATQNPEPEHVQGSNNLWNHYDAVAPTLDDSGIKEYWVNCETHEHQFTAPTDATPVEMGAPSKAFINSLPSNDDRLIQRYRRGFNFDDGVNPYITIKSGFDSMSVVDGEGLNGSKALKLTRATSGDSFIRMNKDYLDIIFANPNVKSLAFAAKAHAATNNFRHIKVDASYVDNNSYIIECFERNGTGWGISTEWKTFYLTRGVYSQMNMSNGSLDYFAKFGVSGTTDQVLYLDDFRVCTEDYYDYTYNGLENGYMSSTELKDPIVNQRYFWVQNATNQGFDYETKTEGIRSFKLDKVNGENAFYLGAGMNSLLGENDYLTFDFRGTVALNNTNQGIRDGNRNNLACLGSSFPANKWVTITIPKSGITSDGRFFIPGGSATGTYWIDNIRINHASYSFEDNHHTSIFGNYANVSHYEVADETASNTLRDGTKDYLLICEWGGWTVNEITDEKASDGAYSVKLTVTGGDKPVRAMPMWYEIMDDDSTLSFDIYTDNMTFTGKCASVPKGAWTTVTFAKADFAANYRIFDSSNNKLSAGTMYLDNFVLVL